jgi:hypothetical protein
MPNGPKVFQVVHYHLGAIGGFLSTEMPLHGSKTNRNVRRKVSSLNQLKCGKWLQAR